MALTLWNIVVIVIVGIAALMFSYAIGENGDFKHKKVFVASTTLIVVLLSSVFFIWYNTSTASGVRAYKDWQSNINNGINREITITAEDGREIFHYEGKVDIESNHEDNYIKFEGEDDKRYIIYYGIQDTITIIEK